MHNIHFQAPRSRSEHWRLQTSLILPIGLEQVFRFFADAENLEQITPSWLHFHIVTRLPLAMHKGTLIDYRLQVRGVPLRWRSEISDWQPPYRFVDRQLRGPYRHWTHTHAFESCADGTLVSDDVEYSVPGGRLVHDWLVRPDLERIFAYRHRALLDRFPQAAIVPLVPA